MPGNDLGQHIAQIGFRIDLVDLAGFDKQGNNGPVFAATIGGCLAAERNRTD
jgi:hypothetical protein